MAKEKQAANPEVTGFIRARIRAWVDAGQELQELAKVAGVAKSHPSQVLAGVFGVGGKSIGGYAKAMGFTDGDALRKAAHEWWLQEGRSGAAAVALPQTEALKGALETLISLKQGTSAQLETILAAYSHSRFLDRDQDWWTNTLLEELVRDRKAMRQSELDREVQAGPQRKHRALKREKDRLEAENSASPTPQPAKRSHRAAS